LLKFGSTFCMQDDYSLSPTTLGRIASYYYLSHSTVRMFRNKLTASAAVPELISILAVRKSSCFHYGQKHTCLICWTVCYVGQR